MNGEISPGRMVFIGHDPRQPLSYNVMRYSIERHATRPVPITGLILDQLPISRQGATEFTFSRFLVPHLMGFEGIGLFADEDMVVRGDIFELLDWCANIEDPQWTVAVRKDQPPFEWPSVMVFNCKNLTHLTPEFVQDEANPMFGFGWTEEDTIVSFPPEWNHCCGMMAPNLDAKLFHWTQGIPYWTECRGLPEDDFWFEEYAEMIKSVQWVELHRNTKHFGAVMERFLTQYGLNVQFGPKKEQYVPEKNAHVEGDAPKIQLLA